RYPHGDADAGFEQRDRIEIHLGSPGGGEVVVDQSFNEVVVFSAASERVEGGGVGDGNGAGVGDRGGRRGRGTGRARDHGQGVLIVGRGRRWRGNGQARWCEEPPETDEGTGRHDQEDGGEEEASGGPGGFGSAGCRRGSAGECFRQCPRPHRTAAPLAQDTVYFRAESIDGLGRWGKAGRRASQGSFEGLGQCPHVVVLGRSTRVAAERSQLGGV